MTRGDTHTMSSIHSSIVNVLLLLVLFMYFSLYELFPAPCCVQEQYGLGFFQSLSKAVYNLLDKYRQYQHYLEYIAFVDLNPPTLQQGQDLFLTPTPSTTVLTPSQSEYSLTHYQAAIHTV